MTVSQIADLAAVGPSAVSNWRRRFGDFPQAVQAAPGGRNLFELEDVERWLEQHGRLSGESGGKRLIFEAADLLRSKVSADTMVEVLGAALALVACVQRRSDQPPGGLADAEVLLTTSSSWDLDLGETLLPLREIDRRTARHVLGLVLRVDAADLSECFDWVLSRGRQLSPEAHSSEVTTALLAALTEGEGGVIYDPAAGSGGFLLALWRNSPVAERPELFAQELSSSAWRIARQKFLVEDIPVSLVRGDSLTEDAWPELRAEIVVCDPPYRMKRSWPTSAAGDPRWISGRPPAQTDFAWLQHVAFHLSTDGRGYVFLPAGSLFRRGKEADLRRELLLEGAVEAIVALPPRSAHGTNVALALWVLRRPDRSGDHDSVLMVDPVASGSTSGAVLDGKSMTRVAQVLREWRAGNGIEEWNRALATSVPILNLLRRDANLAPARWLSSNLTIADRERQQGELVESMRVLEKSRRALVSVPQIPEPQGDRPPRQWMQLDQLVADGAAQVIRGIRIRPEDCVSAGSPVIRTGDVVAGLEGEAPSCFVDLQTLKPRPILTRPGDVVLSAARGRLTAAVDRRGGHVLATPLQGLRLAPQSIDPDLVAAFLESPRNRRFLSGTVLATVDLRDLEVPLLPAAEAQDLAASLDALREQEQLADRVGSSSRRLREILLNLASSSFGTEDEDG